MGRGFGGARAQLLAKEADASATELIERKGPQPLSRCVFPRARGEAERGGESWPSVGAGRGRWFWEIVFEVIDSFGRGGGAIGGCSGRAQREVRGRRRRHPIATSWAGGSEVHALSFWPRKPMRARLNLLRERGRSRSLAAFSRAREAKPSAAVNRGRALERAAVVGFGKLFLR